MALSQQKLTEPIAAEKAVLTNPKQVRPDDLEIHDFLAANAALADEKLPVFVIVAENMVLGGNTENAVLRELYQFCCRKCEFHFVLRGKVQGVKFIVTVAKHRPSAQHRAVTILTRELFLNAEFGF